MLVRLGKAHESIDFIAHVTEAASLIAVPIDGEIFATQCLLHKIRDNAAVIQLHSRTVGVEDADNVCVDLVIPAISHGYGFGETLRFVVHRPRTNRIHIAPVSFLLWMLERISVTFGRGRDEILRAIFVCHVEGVKGS